MKYQYQSHFKQYIEGMLKQKRALGVHYRSSEAYLRRFDIMCLTEFPDETNLTKEIGQKWAMILSTEKRTSFRNRLSPIRELAQYMNRLGLNAYIVEPLTLPESARRATPHIFTDARVIGVFRRYRQH